jgi:hypothetical protein
VEEELKRKQPEQEQLVGKLSHFGKVKAKLRAAFKKYGWKLGVLIVLGYLIRDSILYILIPYLIAKKLIAD